MPKLLTSGLPLETTMGVAKVPFIATETPGAPKELGLTVATILQCVPMVNIPSFGTCTSLANPMTASVDPGGTRRTDARRVRTGYVALAAAGGERRQQRGSVGPGRCQERVRLWRRGRSDEDRPGADLRDLIALSRWTSRPCGCRRAGSDRELPSRSKNRRGCIDLRLARREAGRPLSNFRRAAECGSSRLSRTASRPIDVTVNFEAPEYVCLVKGTFQFDHGTGCLAGRGGGPGRLRRRYALHGRARAQPALRERSRAVQAIMARSS